MSWLRSLRELLEHIDGIADEALARGGRAHRRVRELNFAAQVGVTDARSEQSP